MNQLKKELFEQHGKARIFRFYNAKSGKTISFKVYDEQRKYIVTTDNIEYARRRLDKST